MGDRHAGETADRALPGPAGPDLGWHRRRWTMVLGSAAGQGRMPAGAGQRTIASQPGWLAPFHPQEYRRTGRTRRHDRRNRGGRQVAGRRFHLCPGLRPGGAGLGRTPESRHLDLRWPVAGRARRNRSPARLEQLRQRPRTAGRTDLRHRHQSRQWRCLACHQRRSDRLVPRRQRLDHQARDLPHPGPGAGVSGQWDPAGWHPMRGDPEH